LQLLSLKPMPFGLKYSAQIKICHCLLKKELIYPTSEIQVHNVINSCCPENEHVLDFLEHLYLCSTLYVLKWLLPLTQRPVAFKLYSNYLF